MSRQPVTIEFEDIGTVVFEYEPTDLELLVDKLVQGFGVALPPLTPKNEGQVYFLQKQVEIFAESRHFDVWYRREPSPIFRRRISETFGAPLRMNYVVGELYKDLIPEQETACVSIDSPQDTRKAILSVSEYYSSQCVTRASVYCNDIARNLAETQVQSTLIGLKPEHAMLHLDFTGTAPLEPGQSTNKSGDLKNTFNFLRNYLHV